MNSTQLMAILVLGGGGREHALAWKLNHSPNVAKIFTAPGNPGTAEIGTNLALNPTDAEAVLQAVREHQIELVVIGPELPLVKGVADKLRENGVRVFGPGADGAQLEGSKVWAKQFMQRYNIPTADYQEFDTLESALSHLEGLRDGSYVIKVDGLAAGKGVFIPSDRAEAQQVLREQFAGDIPGGKLVIEERLDGVEISVFAIGNGKQFSNLLAACDYKRAYDNDEGPNTGGMGCYSPPLLWNQEVRGEVEKKIFTPLLKGLNSEDIDYRGVIYAGLMMTDQGPKVLEFNVRFGDPECQALMVLLADNFADVCQAAASSEPLDDTLRPINDNECSVAVSVVSGNYPGSSETGFVIDGITAAGIGAQAFHAGTRMDAEKRVVTAGGRVLTVVGIDSNIETARKRAYAAAKQIQFKDARYRSDIASGGLR